MPDWTDRSGTITSGGTAQQVAAAKGDRHYLMVENVHVSEDLWFNVGAVAVAGQPSIRLVGGAVYESPAHFCPSGLVSVIAATTGHGFSIKEG